MKIKAKRTIHHDTAGTLRVNEVGEVPEPWASRFIERGHAERYETKVIRQEPTVAPAEPTKSKRG